ncbi:MAG: hypothetical protein II304_02395 [Bacteroidales bacterium]|nr:hypothetical protein [Bacteroidales bacterium]
MMKSRYDYMNESSTTDIDNEKFPDPLSTTFNDIQLTKVPPQVQVTDADITKFWLFMNKNYGMQEMDDILLNINGIHYLGSLRPGDVLYLIDQNDVFNFNEQKLGGEEDF